MACARKQVHVASFPYRPDFAHALGIHGFLNNNGSHCCGTHIVIQSCTECDSGHRLTLATGSGGVSLPSSGGKRAMNSRRIPFTVGLTYFLIGTRVLHSNFVTGIGPSRDWFVLQCGTS